MVVLFLTIAYTLVHAVLHAVWLRRTSYGQSERGVFLYFFGSFFFVTITVLSLSLALDWPNPFSTTIAVAAAHGIYALSALEVFALSDGGYSLRILNFVACSGDEPRNKIVDTFANLSDQKKTGRLEFVVKLGFANECHQVFHLNHRGRLLADTFIAIRRIVGYRDAG